MRPRDLLIVAAVLLVAGFAAADALRGLGGGPAATPPTAPAGTQSGESITDPSRTAHPRLHRRGAPRPHRVHRGNVRDPGARPADRNDLPAPPPRRHVQALVAAPLRAACLQPSVEASLRGALPHRRSGPRLSGPGPVPGPHRLDSCGAPDGQRVAWCDARGKGRELEIGEATPAELPGCPAGYTDVGNLVYVHGRELRVGDRLLVRASGGIDAISFGDDGSVALAVDGRTIQVYRRTGGRLSSAAEFGLAPPLQGRVPTFSPDNCGAFFRTPVRRPRRAHLDHRPRLPARRRRTELSRPRSCLVA